MHQYFVYIMTNKPNGVLYVGITNDLIRRCYEHKKNLADSFSRKYNLHRLVYYEDTADVNEAIAREKRLKRWHRKWKLKLVNKFNPDWHDLSVNIMD